MRRRTAVIVTALTLGLGAAPGGNIGAAQSPVYGVDVDGPGVLEKKASRITPENPIPRRIFSVAPTYPNGVGDGDTVPISLRITIDEFGRVAEIRSIDGRARFLRAMLTQDMTPDGRALLAARLEATEAFTRSAIEAVSRWIYGSPADAPIAFDLTFTFKPGAREATLVAHGSVQRPIMGFVDHADVAATRFAPRRED